MHTAKYRNAFPFQVAMKALGFDVKKAEALKLLKDYDRDGTGNMFFEDFYDISAFTRLLQISSNKTYKLPSTSVSNKMYFFSERQDAGKESRGRDKESFRSV